MEAQDGIQKRPRAVFMAFGTKGDVLPVAAVVSALAKEQKDYLFTFITHAAHEYLKFQMAAANVSFCAISTPPVLPLKINNDEVETDLQKVLPSFKTRALEHRHRKECLTAVEKIFGKGPEVQGDFIAINFFALEGWHLSEFFQVPCVVTAPYVVPYSAPSTFERRFQIAQPLLYKRLQEVSPKKVCWGDVMHWMWPLFTERWASWRTDCLHLSSCPLTDPVTGLPISHGWPESPLLLYGFSKEVVECPDYWPANVHVCGFWFPSMDWEFTSQMRPQNSYQTSIKQATVDHLKSCQNVSAPASISSFLAEDFMNGSKPIFIGLSSIGSMGYIENPEGMLLLMKAVLEATSYRIILFSSGYPPLDAAIKSFAGEFLGANNLHDASANYGESNTDLMKDGVQLFNNRLLCYSGSMPYSWLFPKCSVVIHHGGSGTTAAALRAGVPQIICPFILDQFYWAERMNWIGVAPPPLKKKHLIPDNNADGIMEAANSLLNSILMAMAAEMKDRAADIAERICFEDGVENAVNILVNKVCISANRMF